MLWAMLGFAIDTEWPKAQPMKLTNALDLLLNRPRGCVQNSALAGETRQIESDRDIALKNNETFPPFTRGSSARGSAPVQ